MAVISYTTCKLYTSARCAPILKYSLSSLLLFPHPRSHPCPTHGPTSDLSSHLPHRLRVTVTESMSESPAVAPTTSCAQLISTG